MAPVNGSTGDSIPVNDRGLAYGDGLFETIRLHDHRAVLLTEHLDRLLAGAQRLHIAVDRPALETEIGALADRFPERGVLKIIVTRGAGGRGYRPAATGGATRILTLHPLPDYGQPDPGQGIDTFVCRQRLAIQPALAGMKHLNRLEQVLASLEWPDDSFREGLMLDMDGNVVEGTRSNVFWVEAGRLLTPSLARCGVDGVMRQYLIHRLPGVVVAQDSPLERLLQAQAMFVCNSIVGVWPVSTIRHDGVTTAIGSGHGAGAAAVTQARDLFRGLLASRA